LAKISFQSYRDLLVWQAGMALAEIAIGLRELFRDEAFGMTAQIRRAAASVPATVAEGHGRENTGSFIQYLRIAQGSTKELETHLLLAHRVGLLELDTLEPLLSRSAEIGKMLRSLIRALQRKAAVP
jgi:four helix bundle protein